MYLYLCQKTETQNLRGGPYSSSGFSEAMVRKALRDYCVRRKLLLTEQELAGMVIRRGVKGKPYFSDGSEIVNGAKAIHFSVSHSGDYWGCLMADEPVGFDMEVIREKVQYKKIAHRFFAAEECEMIRAEGRESFFEVWVRKEAYVKYLGTGLSEGLSGFSVVSGGGLSQRVMHGTNCFLGACTVHDGVKAAYCCSGSKPLEDTIWLEPCPESIQYIESKEGSNHEHE